MHVKLLNDNEKVITRISRHPIVFILEAIGLALCAALPYLMYRMSLHSKLAEIPGLVPSEDTFLFFFYLWLIVLWTMFFIRWLDFILDHWILTNERLIDVEQKGFFNREVSTLHLSKVEDITIKTTGILYTFLNIGTIRVQTAGAEREFAIRDVGRPEVVKTEISRAIETGNTNKIT